MENTVEMALALPTEVKTRIEALENDVKPVLDYEIASDLGAPHRAEGLSQEERKGAWAEVAAFNFMTSRTGDESVWGTYFAPMSSWTTADGKEVYGPDIEELDLAIVEHWERRSDRTPHPVLRARYAI